MTYYRWWPLILWAPHFLEPPGVVHVKKHNRPCGPPTGGSWSTPRLLKSKVLGYLIHLSCVCTIVHARYSTCPGGHIYNMCYHACPEILRKGCFFSKRLRSDSIKMNFRDMGPFQNASDKHGNIGFDLSDPPGVHVISCILLYAELLCIDKVV